MIRRFVSVIEYILRFFLIGMISFLCFAFILFEGRLLFSGDWMVYDIPFFGCLRYLCRLILAIILLAYMVFEVVYVFIRKKTIFLRIFSRLCAFGGVIIGLFLAIFASNGIEVLGPASLFIYFLLKLDLTK